MRIADILGLALSALWQQKARTLLTTLGVIFGSFVLAASLSIGRGVQETIEREARRSTQLRKVDVQPQWQRRESDIPAEQVRVEGRYNDARRERIRQALVNRKVRFNPLGPRVALTRDRLRFLARIEHVETVIPVVGLNGWAVFGQRSESATVGSAVPDSDSLRRRIVAGRFFETPDEPSAVVTEFLLYQAGMADDAAMDGIVGQKVRLEFHPERRATGLGMYLVKPDALGATREESSALEKIKNQLPGRLDQFDLTTAERDLLGRALRESPPKRAEVYGTEVTITGVLRMETDEERKDQGRTMSWEEGYADVVLPLRTAEDLFFRPSAKGDSPTQGDLGVYRAVLVVDQEKNVKAVVEQVKQMDLNAYAATEWIDQQRLMYLLIFGAMTCIAGVALLVAALGITNTMLMSVLERMREVGIMKAVGAGNGHIQLIFLVEGALIGLVGGGLGLLLSWAASIPGDRWVRSMVQRDLKIELKEALFVFPPWLLLTVVLFAVLVTTLAAFYPARRAAKLSPVTALRHE
jgi:putative ABC transport system permease protein